MFCSFVRQFIDVTAFLFLLSFALTLHSQTTATCSFTVLSTPSGYSQETPGGDNKFGSIVGSIFSPPSHNTSHLDGFILLPGGKTTTYAYPGATDTWFSKRNDSKVNVGAYQDKGGHLHGLVVNGNDAVTINYPAGQGASDVNTQLNGINNYGTIVGSYSAFVKGTFSNSGFKIKNKVYTKISYPGATRTIPLAINNQGDILGYYNTAPTSQPDPVNHGFVLLNGFYRTLDDPRGKGELGTELEDMNSNGVIVGDYLTKNSTGATSHGFIYKNGSFKNVDYPGARNTSVGGINDHGLIVGDAVFSTNTGAGHTLKPFKAQCQ